MPPLSSFEGDDPEHEIVLTRSGQPFDVDGFTDLQFLIFGTAADSDDLVTATVTGGQIAVDPHGNGDNHRILVELDAGDMPDPGKYRWRLVRVEAGRRLTIVAPDAYTITDL